MIKILHYIGFAMILIAGKGLYDIWKYYKDSKNTDKQLIVGYTYGMFRKKTIIVDMEKTPHLFVCGISGYGKTRMIEYAIKDKQVFILNGKDNDFKDVCVEQKISGKAKISEFLTKIIDKPPVEEGPLYIVIDELLVLCMDSKLQEKIIELIAIGRHYNIYIIGISQIGIKEVVKYKELFSARVCFRQIESSYEAVLGYRPENTDLKRGEFYLCSDQKVFGYTYDIRLDAAI